ncbi:MAG: AraC family transcriptional regulator [Lachnospiraceae bacterium]|nr:AraC family transcriptional regulator [Lachnospiraceae bacterium]
MIHVTACGHDSHHPKPCNIEHQRNLPDYLVLLVKQDAWFEIHGQKIHTRPNMIILFPPESYIHYGRDQAGYNDDWIHFHPEAEACSFLEDLSLPMETPLYPHDFFRLSQYVLLLSDTFHGTGNNRQQIIDVLMRGFLMDLQDKLEMLPPEGDAKYYAELALLRSQIYNDPAAERTIPQLAESMLLSISYFQHLYKKFFGCSCSRDIINARLKLARFYLTGSTMTVKEISDFCGYENDFHFMRQFKKYLGMTPSEYRAQNMS